ncbi:hypothetical protein LEN26_001704, partial [Aphanomyces euteiches]
SKAQRKSMIKCFFNDCESPVLPGSWKCYFHRRRGRCLVDNCANQVYARRLCVRHGGRSQCQHENCTMNQRVGNFCWRHATTKLKKTCSHPGCGKQAHARGKCVRHGGGRLCKAPNCSMYARHGSYCTRHSHSQTIADINNWANAVSTLYVQFDQDLDTWTEDLLASTGSVEPLVDDIWVQNLLDPNVIEEVELMPLYHLFYC